jgi:DNA repair exonuclease SbcCD ATPase subunit
MSAETWYTGRECLENGLKCTVVASDMKAAAKIGSRQFGKMPEAAAKLYEFRQMDDATKAEIEKVKAEQTAGAETQTAETGTAPAETGTAPAETGTAPAETGTPAAETATPTAEPVAAAGADVSHGTDGGENWEARFKGASKKINELQDAIKAHEATIADLKSQVDKAGKDLAAANAQVSELTGTIEKQAQDLKAKENDLAEVRNSLTKANEHVKHLEETRNLLTGGVLSLPEDSAKVDVDSGKTPEAREELRKKIQAKKNKLKK